MCYYVIDLIWKTYSVIKISECVLKNIIYIGMRSIFRNPSRNPNKYLIQNLRDSLYFNFATLNLQKKKKKDL